jgi:hypothetical protein
MEHNQDRHYGRQPEAAPAGTRLPGKGAICEMADREYERDSSRLEPDPYQDDGGEA